MNIGTLSDYEVALDKLQGEIDLGPITESEVEMSSRLGIPPRAMTDEDWHALSQPQTGQSVDSDYGPQGLKQVSPALELFGLGLGKIAVNAASKTKMYSDQVVDRISRFKTPNTTYHGGEKNIGTLRTTYDRSMRGEKIDDDTLFRPTFSSRFPQTGPPTTKTQSTPFQAGLYTAGKKVAEDYAYPSRKALYEIDTSVAKKIYDFNKPSKFMGKKLDEEIKLAEEAKDLRKVRELESLKRAKNSLLQVTPTQRDFLEANGYDAIRTLNASGPKTDLKRTVILLRPEKYKFKEIPK